MGTGYLQIELQIEHQTLKDIVDDLSSLTIQVKLDDEGVVIDALAGEGENVGTTWKLYSEMDANAPPTPESVMASAAADMGPTLDDLIDNEAVFTSQELATVLAALRYWQRKYRPEREGGANGHGVNDWLIDIATGGGEFATLDTTEIDALCERLNVQ
jgi:hypothetical protein